MAKPQARYYDRLTVLPTLEKELWQSADGSLDKKHLVLPTLEKELWQSSSLLVGITPAVLPTLEKELWQSRKRVIMTV